MSEPPDAPASAPEGGDAPGLEIVVIAYGDPGDLERCLEVLGGHLPVLVFDNSSSAAVRDVASRAGAAYRCEDVNLGFATAVNRSVAELDLARTDVLLLNPDAAIDPDAVERLHRKLLADPRLACVAPAQRQPESGVEVRVRWPFATPGRAWKETIGLGRRLRAWDFVIGSVLLVRGTAFLDVGRLDERFFLYGEEADWERRAVGNGWRIGYCPEITALHRGGAADVDPERRLLRFHAGVELHVRKWHGKWGWLSYRTASTITALRRALRGDALSRRRALHLAALYARGPLSVALQAGVLPGRAGPELGT